MVSAGGESAVMRAVQQLHSSRSSADEALAHMGGAVDAISDVWASYRQAAGDSGSALMRDAGRTTLKAWESINTSASALNAARAGVLAYVEAIAPGGANAVSDGQGTQPSGEALLDTRHRPRSLRDLIRESGRDAEDVHDLADSAKDVSHSIRELFHPPDPGSLKTATHPASEPPVVSSGARGTPGNDPFLTYTLVAILLADSGRRLGSRVRAAFTKGKHDGE